MAIKREKKEQIIDGLKNSLKSAQSIVFVNFHGLNVGNTTSLRRKLREEGVDYTVAKKTLIKRVLDDIAPSGEQPSLDGELAICYGEDLLAPAREVYEFQKTHKNNIAILGGIFEGAYKSKEEMIEIALIPAPQVLRAQFVNLINSPLQGFVMALNAIAEKKEKV